MAKEAREMIWLQCTECKDLNYRSPIRVAGQSTQTKLELKQVLQARAQAHAAQGQAQVTAALNPRWPVRLASGPPRR